MAKRIQWLGNSLSGEFHRIEPGAQHPPECNLDKMKSEHRVLFKTGKEALNADFDPAAWCNKHFKSRHNATRRRDDAADELYDMMNAETREE